MKIYFILSLIIGVSFAIFVWSIFLLEKGLNPSTLKRLERIKHKRNSPSDYSASERINLLLQDSEFRFQAIGNIVKNYRITETVKEMIKLADVNWHPDTFFIFSAACGLPFLMFLLTPLFPMVLLAFGAILIPTFYLKHLINQRFLNFSKQFPDALNLMASSLRAGHPLYSAINIVTDEMPKPICDVFATAQKDISLGVDSKEAFLSMTKVMPQSIDLRFFITAVLIQKEVGGNLAELLDSLSGTIRERFKLLGQLRVQTAQTRISGLVLGIVPIAVLLIITFMNPDYIKPLFDSRDGQIAFFSAIGLIIGGFVSIKKISNIEI